MNVVITGGAGFIGRRLAGALAERGRLTGRHGGDEAIEQITLLDVVAPAAAADSRIVSIAGDLADRSIVERAIDSDTQAVFHLAAVVSGSAEADFELGMRVNLDASRLLLDVCRARGHKPRVVFTSSVAVYGGDLPATVLDSTIVTPQTSYGTQKAITDLLIADYTRRGFIDGRSVRLPTISVRPGRPNTALSSFASGIIREPINGEIADCPVGPETKMWLLSPRSVIACLVRAHELQSEALGWNRTINLPGLSVSVGEMVASLERIAGPEVAARVRWRPDPLVQRVVATWPGELEAARARALGFQSDPDFDSIVRQYIDENARR